jgi:hypothetical protein
MSAVVEVIEDVVGGVVEAVGSIVEGIGDLISDVGVAIDKYVIQPILDDPLTALATVAAATFLGPAAAGLFGTSATVGVGIAAGFGNTAAGLVQGEDFETAIKGGLAAGLGSYAGAEFFGGTGGEGSAAATDPLDDFLAANNNFVDVPMDSLAAAPSAVSSPVRSPDITTTDLPPASAPNTLDVSAPTATVSPLESVAPPIEATAASATPSPLESLNTTVPQVKVPEFELASLDKSFAPDYSLTGGMQSGAPGFNPSKFTPADSFDIYGQPNYSLTPPGTSGGPGMQFQSSPNLAGMRGGQGLTADVSGLSSYMDDGVSNTFEGANGRTYGKASPDMTIGSRSMTPEPQIIPYDSASSVSTPSLYDQIAEGNFTDAAKNIGNKAVDYYKNASPFELAGVGLTAASLFGGSGGTPPSAPPPKGSTQDKSFNKSLDLYKYMRDKTNYQGDLGKYGQVGQPNAAEHQYFQNTQFVPLPIGAKMGGLIQMKHFAQGGQAQGMRDPRQAQMMQAMAQQRQAGQGGSMGMAQARPPMMQGGPQRMPQGTPPQGQQGMPQRMPQQGMQQGRPQMPQRPRDPKMAYYQYGNPPAKAMAMGGLNQVHSMRIGGGADGRSDDVNAVLSDGEYVFDSESVAMLGNGSSKAGAAKLDQMRSKLRQHKGQALANGKISPDAKSPLAYLKGA